MQTIEDPQSVSGVYRDDLCHARSCFLVRFTRGSVQNLAGLSQSTRAFIPKEIGLRESKAMTVRRRPQMHLLFWIKANRSSRNASFCNFCKLTTLDGK